MSTDLNELIQLAIDGEATPEQRAELQERLAASAENRAAFALMQDLANQLERMPMVEPTSPMQWRPASASRTPRVRRYSRPLLAFAYTAAAVLIIVFAVQRALPPSQTAATMTRLEEDWPVVARAVSAEGKLTIRGNGSEFAVEVTGSGPASLEWDRSKLAGPAEAAFQNYPETVHLRRRAGAAGPAVVRLHLPDKPGLQATIDLR